MPTVEVTHKFPNSCYFTKLDAHHGYWSIVLDEESSLLTTFNSPFGRYHFLHLPFHLVCSQDILQKKMCPGCIGIADGITIHGHMKEHDACLQNLMQVACKYGLVFNSQKMQCKGPSCNFFGCLYDANSVHLNLEKVMLFMLSQHPQMSVNSKSSLAWWHTSAPLSWPVHSDHSSVRTHEKRCQLHLECQLWGHFSASQVSCHQWHHPQVLQPGTACDHTSQCLTGRTWCSTSTR